jgi:hypothetical protein
MEVLGFLTLALMLYGLFLLAFRRGRRKRGAWVATGALIAAVLLAQIRLEQKARASGFQNLSDMRAAEKAGLPDAPAWSAHKVAMAEQERAAAAAVAAEER